MIASAGESAPPRGVPASQLKVDLHIHSAEDPHDHVGHSAIDLLQRAHELGFDVLAITLHGHVLDRPEVRAVAEAFGIWLIPAAEMRIEGADVVLLNISEEEAAELQTWDDLRRLRARRGRSLLVFAPHPFFVLGGSMGAKLNANFDCFDAIEYCHFHTRGWNLNRGAVRIANERGMPLLATSDAHRLDFFGSHYSLVSADANRCVEDFFDAIRAGRFQTVSPAWPWIKFLRYLGYLLLVHPLQVLTARL